MKVLVTGVAGFIGFHVAKKLLERGDEVTGIDNINDYYDVNLKYSRLMELGVHLGSNDNQATSVTHRAFEFFRIGVEDECSIKSLFANNKFDRVVHLAAQAGVRYSLENPRAYVQSNLVGFLNILEGCRYQQIEHLVYASSSSVYGANESIPFSVHDNVDHPLSLYAASKKSNELMAHTYSHLYDLPTTGLRFFTVYGPWGRPDMAPMLFAKAILEGKPIDVYNHGNMERDFTYIDDIVEGTLRVLDKVAQKSENWRGDAPDPATSKAPWRIYNIGNSSPVNLMAFIAEIEKTLGVKARKNFFPMQPGDVPATWADINDLKEETGFVPVVTIGDGVKRFIDWYSNYYRHRYNECSV